jgi:uncharacterized coiled-coil DUF342 family protein
MPKKKDKDPDQPSPLRNFDLSVDEIKLEKSIEQLVTSLSNIEHADPHSTRARYIRSEINKLKEKLEEIRENTLIR